MFLNQDDVSSLIVDHKERNHQFFLILNTNEDLSHMWGNLLTNCHRSCYYTALEAYPFLANLFFLVLFLGKADSNFA